MCCCVDNTLMFLVVAGQSRTLQLLTLAWPARCVGSWEGTQLGQLTQTGHRDVPYRMASCSVHSLGVAKGQRLLLEDRLGIGHRVASNCIVHHLLYIIYYHHHLFLCFPIKLSLPQPLSFTLFSSSPSCWEGGEVSGRRRGPGCRLG